MQASHEHRRRSLLLIDDDDEMSDAMCLLLEGHGYDVTRCEHAGEALALLRSGVKPDLIVLDLCMPEMDGWQFRVEQRKEPTLARIPVVAVTGDLSPQAAAIDVHAFLRKPVDGAQLLDTLQEVLERAGNAELELANPAHFLAESLEAARQHCRALERETPFVASEHGRALSRLLEHAHRSADALCREVDRRSPFHDLGESRSGTVDVLELLRASCLIVQPELPPSTRITQHLRQVPRASGDPVRLGHVLLNILRNAAESLRETLRPKLHLQVWLEGESHVLISITENGRGMSAAVRARAFEPFTSSKVGVPGAGLGLATARALVHSMGGALEFDSAEGCGTTFLVALPREPASLSFAEHITPRGQELRVMLVSDHAERMACLAAVLAQRVRELSIRSASEALTELLRSPTYDLLVLDGENDRLSAMEFYAMLGFHEPQQAGRLVLLCDEDSTPRSRSLLDRLGVWHEDRSLAPEQLADRLLMLLELWAQLGLSGPPPRLARKPS